MSTTSDDLDVESEVEATDTAVDLEKPAAKVTPKAHADAPGDEPVDEPKRLSKAEKLEARAARLREAELAREQRRREAAAAGSSARKPLPWMISTGVLAVLLALVLGFGIPYLIDKRDAVAHNSAVNSARSQALATAKKAAVAFGSYNYTQVDKDFAATLSYLTPKFRKAYSPVAAQLKPYIAKGRAVATAKVSCSAVSSASTTRVVIVMCLDQSVTTSDSKTATINRNRAIATLVKQSNGHWLVDDLVLR
jgi:Mce-associated membrane protein